MRTSAAAARAPTWRALPVSCARVAAGPQASSAAWTAVQSPAASRAVASVRVMWRVPAKARVVVVFLIRLFPLKLD